MGLYLAGTQTKAKKQDRIAKMLHFSSSVNDHRPWQCSRARKPRRLLLALNPTYTRPPTASTLSATISLNIYAGDMAMHPYQPIRQQR